MLQAQSHALHHALMLHPITVVYVLYSSKLPDQFCIQSSLHAPIRNRVLGSGTSLSTVAQEYAETCA